MSKYLLGIDVSTTGAKALLVREDGQVAASVTSEYPLYNPRPLWSEQNPEDWWQGSEKSIRAALEKAGLTGEDVAAVGLTGQMHGMVLLGPAGEVLRPAILWNDQRTGPQCEQITRQAGGIEKLVELTGNPVLPGFTAPKIVWTRENEPEVYRRAAKVLLPKDYVRYRLSNEFFTEVSDASGTSLLDVCQRKWSAEMLDLLEIPADWLPVVTESTEASTRVSDQAAGETGLLEGTPIVGGGGDQAAQAVGTGIVQEGLVSVTLGTSGVVFAASDTYRPEPAGRLHAFCHAVPGKWHWMGVMLSAAGSFRWFRDTLGQAEKIQAEQSGKDAYDLLTGEAAGVSPGSEGLFFLPYLSGERTPYPDPDARGAFIGLTLRHTKAHMTRSVLEGVSYGLRDSLELMRNLGLNIDQVRASGGGARSPLWRQILADVFNTEIVTANVTEGAAYGAALLAGVGAGIFPSVEKACEKTIRVTGQLQPSQAASIYAQAYPIYRALYPALAAQFQAISKLKS